MSGLLVIRNRQRVHPVDTALLRRILHRLLAGQLHADDFELCFHLVGRRQMTRINESFLHHPGSTDVITFDHRTLTAEGPGPTPGDACLRGEIFVSVADAVLHARAFRTTWQSELLRYCIHGLLHLRGEDDLAAPARRRMKQAEGRILRRLAREFNIARLARGRSRRPRPAPSRFP